MAIMMVKYGIVIHLKVGDVSSVKKRTIPAQKSKLRYSTHNISLVHNLRN